MTKSKIWDLSALCMWSGQEKHLTLCNCNFLQYIVLKNTDCPELNYVSLLHVFQPQVNFENLII